MTLTATADTQLRTDTNNFAAREQPTKSTKSTPSLAVIDVDVHHQFDKPDVLFPYLPRHYVEWVR